MLSHLCLNIFIYFCPFLYLQHVRLLGFDSAVRLKTEYRNTVKMYTTKGKSNMSRQHISLYIIHFSLAKWQWINLNLVLGNSDSSS